MRRKASRIDKQKKAAIRKFARNIRRRARRRHRNNFEGTGGDDIFEEAEEESTTDDHEGDEIDYSTDESLIESACMAWSVTREEGELYFCRVEEVKVLGFQVTLLRTAEYRDISASAFLPYTHLSDSISIANLAQLFGDICFRPNSILSLTEDGNTPPRSFSQSLK
nr:hypothetical transcript [Hymenolepis microstoma]